LDWELQERQSVRQEGTRNGSARGLPAGDASLPEPFLAIYIPGHMVVLNIV